MARADLHNMEWWDQMAWQSGYNSTVLSKNLQISTRQLHRYTRELFGRSPQDWLDEQRLKIAVGLLVKHRSIKTVTHHLGFKQVSHFSREFKFHYGVSPTEFLEWNDREGENVRNR